MPEKLTYSIVLIAYNQTDWIEEAVKAVLVQECAPLEILLSDDCSTDDTFEKMSRLVDEYQGPHTVVLNRNPNNLGLVGHINRSFELASGEVIISVAGDDICYPNRAARTIETFEAEQPLLSFSHARVETFDGEKVPRVYQKATFYSKQDAQAAAVSMQLYLGATCAWHKDLFRKYGPIKFAECYDDLILGFRAALEGRIAMIDEELVRYRVGAGLTNTEIAYVTPEEFLTRRRHEVKREIMVLRQRLDDAAVFGLQVDDPIINVIEKRLGDRRLRLTYLESGLGKLVHNSWQRPLAILGAVLSERRRLKKALR